MADDVRDYLLRHPSFFEDNDDVLASLVPKEHRNGDHVEDFQRYRLMRLQDTFAAIRDEHDDLMHLMQEHLQRQNRLNVATLSLFDAPDFESVLTFVTRDLRLLLDLEAVGLFLEARDSLELGDHGGLQIVPEGFIERFMAGRDIALEEQDSASPALFGSACADTRSQALIRLSLGGNFPPALLALAHRETMYFATGLATEQMECLGAVVERCLGRFL